MRQGVQRGPLILPLSEVDQASLRLAGGKGVNLGEMTRAGLPVPDGFCVTTAAYALAASGAGMEGLLRELAEVPADDQERIAALAERARQALLGAAVPRTVAAAVRKAYAELGAADQKVAVAVRSSATAEDLGEASFAGQQDSFLNVAGAAAVVDAVRRCWASLWTERAVSYRARNGVDHRDVLICAVIQRMVPASVSGVLFTANPMTGRRGEVVVDAVPGLGDSLVSGQANPDHFVLDPGAGGVRDRRPAAQSSKGVLLDDPDLMRLGELAEEVEARFGAPQDIEWSLDGEGRLWLLQARPITTLFPVPPLPPGGGLHVYLNLSNAQGVLQPLTPMGLELFRRIGAGGATVFGFDVDPERGPSVLVALAGRLFFDITEPLRTAAGRTIALAFLGIMEPRSADSIRQVLADPRLGPPRRLPRGRIMRQLSGVLVRTRLPLRVLQALFAPDLARRRAYAHAEAFIAAGSGTAGAPRETVDRVGWLASQIPGRIFFRVLPPAAVGIFSLALARRLARRAGVEDDAMVVTRGLSHNVTTEMNLELWSVARRLRAAGLSGLLEESAPSELASLYLSKRLPAELQRELSAFLDRYGFRGVAEIDVGVPRWAEDPTPIVGALAGLMRLRAPEMAPDVQFRRAEEEAAAGARRALEQARRRGPGGLARAAALRLLFGRVRALAGIRESPKFYAVQMLGICRNLLLSAGDEIAQEGRIERADDVFFLSIEEVRRALAGEDQRPLVASRRAQYRREFQRRRQPRVLLSDGTGLYGETADAIAGDGRTLTGSAASPGVYTGPARVVLDPAGARLEPGDVLVAPSTDPGWTPLFMTAGALVMEMGGMMSHGAIVAREYGIPAVVGLPGATDSIRTGETVTVDGARGVVVRLAGGRAAEQAVVQGGVQLGGPSGTG
jgi:phosphohistidine swiveling domain-containing protein